MKKNLIDLHTHSVLSTHAFSSLTENIEYAVSIGLEVYGISEHQPDDDGVGSHRFSFANAHKIAPKQIGNTKILCGIELNIMEDGFHLYGIKVNELSYCIASMHTYAYSVNHTKEENTERYIDACKTSFVTMLGHIDNPKYPCDYERVVIAAKENDKIIELNNASLDPDGSRVGAEELDKEILYLCSKYKVPIIMNSDAHIKYQIGDTNRCIELLEKINFPEDLVVNYNKDLFNHYFKFR